jgi:hypothetical protein
MLTAAHDILKDLGGEQVIYKIINSWHSINIFHFSQKLKAQAIVLAICTALEFYY